jgi:shikimate kinase
MRACETLRDVPHARTHARHSARAYVCRRWEQFRALETELLAKHLRADAAAPARVIACGGGVVEVAVRPHLRRDSATSAPGLGQPCARLRVLAV